MQRAAIEQRGIAELIPRIELHDRRECRPRVRVFAQLGLDVGQSPQGGQVARLFRDGFFIGVGGAVPLSGVSQGIAKLDELVWVADLLRSDLQALNFAAVGPAL